MENWISDAIVQWRDEGVELNSPASIEEIELTESTLDIRFPEDFRQLYLIANGFSEWGMQENYFSFWPLDRIVEEYNGSEDKNYVGFCDYLIRCHDIGFVKNHFGVFKSYKEFEHVLIADTYQQIVGMINSDNDLVY